MSNMTKRLPQIQNYRPYKYQEVRRKFRTEVKGGKNISSIQEEDGGGRPLVSRERTNLAISNSNLGVSRENLGASQDSLNKKEDAAPHAKNNHAVHNSHENLRTDIAHRQTSLENLKRREENGKQVYSFSLQKADRSYSEPVLFPPVGERKGQSTSQQTQGHSGHAGQGHGNKAATPQIYTPLTSLARENTLNSNTKEKKSFPVKFPVVTRSDLYKHLGIMPDGRNNKKKQRLDDKGGTGDRVVRDSNHGLPKHILQILPESGGSRHVAVSSNVYGRDVEPIAKNKVEMYKQWHEEQSRKRGRSRPAAHQNEVTKDAVRLASIYREKYNAGDMRTRQTTRNREGTLPKIGVRNNPAGAGGNRSNAPSRVAETQSHGGQQKSHMGPRPESPPAPIPEELKNRIYSAKTWKTWRDINSSYAYVDVKEYIEDNELMDEEKEEWIKDWIIDVDRKYFHPPQEDSDDEEEEQEENSQSGERIQMRSQSDKGTLGDRPGPENVEEEEEERLEVITKAEGITKL